MANESGNSVLIQPMSIPGDLDEKVKRIQNFLAFTTGIKSRKEDVCALLVQAGAQTYEKKMKRFVK